MLAGVGRVAAQVVALAEATQTEYTVRAVAARVPGGQVVLTLVGDVEPGAPLQWQCKPAGLSQFTNVLESPNYYGTTTTTLRIDTTSTAMSGDQFRCVVRTPAGAVLSTTATLVVGPPSLAIVRGNHQSTEAGRFNAIPFDVALWDAAGTTPLVDTPVTFTVKSGGGLLSATPAGTNLDAALTLTTDVDGTAQAYYRHAGLPNILSTIQAVAGTREVIFESTSLAAGATDRMGGAPGQTTRDPRLAMSGKGARTGVIEMSGGLGPSQRPGTNRAASGPTLERSETLLGIEIKLRTRPNEYYRVNTTTWAIASDSGP